MVTLTAIWAHHIIVHTGVYKVAHKTESTKQGGVIGDRIPL